MERIIEYRLGIEAMSYVRDQLRYGTALGESILANIDIDTGVVSTYFPSDVDPDALLRFSSGGVLGREAGSVGVSAAGERYIVEKISTMDQWLVDYVHESLKSEQSRLCIFEDFMGDFEYVSRQQVGSQVVHTGDETYHLITAENADKLTIEATIYAVRVAWRFLCVLATGADAVAEGSLINSKELSRNQIDNISRNAQKIIVGAYDGEGYLIWGRS